MASDQTLPLPPLPAPSNPNQIHTPTAPLPGDDPTPPAARKLPIKRRSPPRPSSSPSSSGPASSGADPLKHPHPGFKFQRIWSESDELRFLQGLLGCGAQGLVFPRDLNVFYDQFSESMPQPYTRSQLSEKLRRLKNKHRSVSTRVAKGLDPARLAPHDRDVLHLCSRLWDPANAATSPFAGPASAGGSSGNKRRRANPQAPLDHLPAPSGDNSYNGISSSAPGAFPDENAEDVMYLEQESGHNLYFDHQGVALAAHCSLDGIAMSQPETVAAFTADNEAAVAFTSIADDGAVAAFTNAPDNGVATDIPHTFANNNHNSNMVADNGNSKVTVPRSNDHRVASAVLDIFEECMREAKAEGTVCDANAEESELAKRWRQQRIDELDVLSRRLRLIIEDSTPAGH
ncbi:hypothetical protein ACQ4PT_000774 [Festuca glaucescens]